MFSARPSIIDEGLSRSTGRFLGRVSSPGIMNNLYRSFGNVKTLPRVVEAASLKRCDQIIGESYDFQEQGIGGEGSGGNLAQGEVFAQFANSWFHPGASIVKIPNPGRSQGQVGDPGTIDITAHGKQSSLRFLRFDESSCNHETTGLLPTVGTMLEFGYLPIAVHRFIPQPGQRSDFFSAHPSSSQLSEIAKLVGAGKLKPIVETVLPLSDARRAHELSETGHARGKIVLKVAQG